MAMGVAAALDALEWKEILGCIAGDDTVMCVTKTADQAEKLAAQLVRMNKYKAEPGLALFSLFCSFKDVGLYEI